MKVSLAGLPALTKLQILAFCEKERTWGEIKKCIKKSDPMLKDHLDTLIERNLLKKTNHLYKSNVKGINIKSLLRRYDHITNELSKLSVVLTNGVEG